MGSGKSAVGKALARKLQYDFIDMDILIERQSGKTISELFTISESYFRSWEATICKSIQNKSKCIISTGGGIVTQPDLMESIQNIGHLIFLEASVETIYNRVKHHSHRPLLNTEKPLETIFELLNKRKNLYKNYASYTINVDTLSIQEISDKIIDNYDFVNA